MNESLQPIFSEDAIRAASRRAFWVSLLIPPLAIFAGFTTAWLLGGAGAGLIARLIGAGVALGLLLACHDWLFLGTFNRQLRRGLEAKLRGLGELDFRLDDPTVYFCGLAHPSRANTRRRETDDDVGFVRLDFDSLTYRGDRFSFRVPFDDLTDVALEPVGAGLPSGIQRLRLRFAGGEPFDEILLTAREGDRLTRANKVTLTLAEAVRGRWQRSRARPIGERLAAEGELAEAAVTER